MEFAQPTWAVVLVYLVGWVIGFRLARAPGFLMPERSKGAADFFSNVIAGAIAALFFGSLANLILSGLVSTW